MKKILFGVAALGLLGLAGAGIGLKAQDTVEAKADTYSYKAGDVFYFDDNNSSAWTGANRVAVYFFGDGDNWYDTVTVVDDAAFTHDGTIYKFVLPDIGDKNYTAMIFVALNSSEPAGWGNKKAQTVNLTFSSFAGTNYFQINDTVYDGKYDCSWSYREIDIANGAYLRGVFGGVEHWGSSGQQFLGLAGNDHETIFTTNFVSLSAGDKVKVVIYHNGLLAKWLNINSVNSADLGLYSVSNDGGDFKVASAASYGFRLYYNNTSEGNEYWDYFAVTTGTEWADAFLNSMTCDASGLTAPVFKKDGESWNTYATSYDALDTIAKDALFGATASDDGSAIQQAAKRHDVIVAHHKYTAFMTNGAKSATRAPAAAAVVTNFNAMSGNDNGATTIAIVAAAAAVLGFGVLFIARKRRAE